METIILTVILTILAIQIINFAFGLLISDAEPYVIFTSFIPVCVGTGIMYVVRLVQARKLKKYEIYDLVKRLDNDTTEVFQRVYSLKGETAIARRFNQEQDNTKYYIEKIDGTVRSRLQKQDLLENLGCEGSGYTMEWLQENLIKQ